ncbi:MAG: putative metal-binding motif-containing protein [Alphaproteobacteria bacterium]|nr:putative metal-binding motif-containing protein [Alphaproteobacteria bacterium]
MPRLPLLCLALTLIACGDKDDTGPTDDTGSGLVDGDADGFPAATDCDDGDASVYPGAAETCDEVDNDCDAAVDEGSDGGDSYYPDLDGDGYGAGTAVSACEAPAGHVDNDEDCDDGDADINPEADELCDAVDNDCDGATDEDAIDGDTFFADLDADGYGDPENVIIACSLPEGATEDDRDCDDSNADINPDGQEVCGGLDEDCDGQIDDDDPDVDPSTYLTHYADADGDGYGDPDGATTEACAPPSGYADNTDDCDDTDGNVNPGAAETWYDGVDADCAGDSDFDADGDGYESDGYGGTDCDDADSVINPGYDESVDCSDPTDYNCDGSVGYDDLDADGWVACQECDDLAATTHPYAWEDETDGVDNDCDGAVDGADRHSPTRIALDDDDSDTIYPSNVTFPFCGSDHSSMEVSSNGIISFTSAILDSSETESEFLGSDGKGPRVAPLWDNLDPADSSSDGVYWIEYSDAVGVYWVDVLERGSRDTNTFSAILLDDGRVILTYPELYVTDGIIGWSCGDGADVDETDLSADWAAKPADAAGLGTGTESAVYERYKSDDNDAAGATWWFCGTAGDDADGDGWTTVCGDADDSDPSVYPQ